MSKLRASVIICTRDRPGQLAEMLRALLAQTRPPEELIVVDSSVMAEPPRQAIDQFGGEFLTQGVNVRLERSSPGLTHQKNIGAALANGDVVVYLDDDAVPRPEFLSKLIGVLEDHAEYDGGMGTIEGIRRRPWLEMFQRFFMLTHNHGSGSFMPSGLPALPHGNPRFSDTEALSGGLTILRKSLLDDYEFDELLSGYAYMEDVDYSWRISRSHRLFYQPQAVLIHPWEAPRGEIAFGRARMFVRNHGYLFFKNIFPGRPQYLIFFIWSIAGYLLMHALRTDVKALTGAIVGLRDLINPWWRQ